jgi:hypothetical protein
MNDSMCSCIPLLNVVEDSKQLYFRNQVPIFNIVPSSCHIIKNIYEIHVCGSPFILVCHSFLDKSEYPITIYFPFGCCFHLVTWIYNIQIYHEFIMFWLNQSHDLLELLVGLVGVFGLDVRCNIWCNSINSLIFSFLIQPTFAFFIPWLWKIGTNIFWIYSFVVQVINDLKNSFIT